MAKQLKITYANQRIEKYFTDYTKMRKKIGLELTRSVKKHVDHLRAANCFEDFLRLRLGRPELLKGYKRPRYSIRVSANVRLIIELVDVEPDTIMICEAAEIEGVSDYHGGKDNWYLS
ncbi:MAG: hypothetical protein SPL39_09995 [Selenomonadaceae bacterium]|nr:hypothetical protein [Selenomonadaceae bacterium]